MKPKIIIGLLGIAAVLAWTGIAWVFMSVPLTTTYENRVVTDLFSR